MEWLNNLIDEAKSYLHVNPEKFYIIVGIAGAALLLLLILIALVVVAVKRKRHNEVEENEHMSKEARTNILGWRILRGSGGGWRSRTAVSKTPV
jgi:flagellar biosynthesis/type III secretory pathway M-ring protein FliF/YscJ